MRSLIVALLFVVGSVGPTHILSDHCAGAVLAMQQEQEWEPRPGNPGHKKPPDGFACKHPHQKPAEGEACECHKECGVTQDEEGNEVIFITEDNARCTVACHPSHCKCPARNCP